MVFRVEEGSEPPSNDTEVVRMLKKLILADKDFVRDFMAEASKIEPTRIPTAYRPPPVEDPWHKQPCGCRHCRGYSHCGGPVTWISIPWINPCWWMTWCQPVCPPRCHHEKPRYPTARVPAYGWKDEEEVEEQETEYPAVPAYRRKGEKKEAE
jgi:hypothetical protein